LKIRSLGRRTEKQNEAKGQFSKFFKRNLKVQSDNIRTQQQLTSRSNSAARLERLRDSTKKLMQDAQYYKSGPVCKI